MPWRAESATLRSAECTFTKKEGHYQGHKGHLSTLFFSLWQMAYKSNYPKHLSMALPRGSPFFPFLHYHIVRYIEKGTLDFVGKRWQPPRLHCPSSRARQSIRASSSSDLSLGLEKLIGLFTILAVGFGSAIAVFWCEGFFSVVVKVNHQGSKQRISSCRRCRSNSI